MSTIHIPTTHGHQPMRIRAAFAALIVAALIGLAALVQVQGPAASQGGPSAIDELRPCAAIADNAARLACFDAIADQAPPQPAKGANAPAAAFAPLR